MELVFIIFMYVVYMLYGKVEKNEGVKLSFLSFSDFIIIIRLSSEKLLFWHHCMNSGWIFLADAFSFAWGQQF